MQKIDEWKLKLEIEYGTIIKRVSLETEDEYFQAIVMDADKKILADAELRI
jgi:hypothetical protein